MKHSLPVSEVYLPLNIPQGLADQLIVPFVTPRNMLP